MKPRLVRYRYRVAKEEKRDAWTLLTSHGHVLVEIVRNPDARIKDLGAAAGITERAAAAIVADLDAAGYVTRSRVGRRNRYDVHLDLPFRHPAQHDLRVGPFLELLAGLPGESVPTQVVTPVPTPVSAGRRSSASEVGAKIAKTAKLVKTRKTAKAEKTAEAAKTAKAAKPAETAEM